MVATTKTKELWFRDKQKRLEAARILDHLGLSYRYSDVWLPEGLEEDSVVLLCCDGSIKTPGWWYIIRILPR